MVTRHLHTSCHATLTASAVDVCFQPPKPSSVKVEDLFQSLGPLPQFSAERRWSRPRTVEVLCGEGGLGLSVRQSRPVVVSRVEGGGAAEVRMATVCTECVVTSWPDCCRPLE